MRKRSLLFCIALHCIALQIALHCIALSTYVQAQLASLPRLDVPKKPTGLFVKLCESSDTDAASREDLTKLAKDANGLLKVS